MSKQVIDCMNLLCPLPVIRVQDQVAGMSQGDVLEAVCSDPGVLQDIPAWCRINGHQVIDTNQQQGVYHVTLQVGTKDQ